VMMPVLVAVLPSSPGNYRIRFDPRRYHLMDIGYSL